MKQFCKNNFAIFLIVVTILIFTINYFNIRFINSSNADVNSLINTDKETLVTPTTLKKTLFFNEPISSNIVLIGNLETGQIIYSKNIDVKTAIASITKWMSAVVYLENSDINMPITIDEEIYKSLPNKNDLLLYERIYAKDLLRMALIMSSNDAIVALAKSLDYDVFINQMNAKAIDLGMYQTKFDNPIGFDSENNYSTALDLFHLAKYVYKNHSDIGEISKKNSYNFTSISGIYHLVVPTNAVLNKLENYWGGKTGLTDQANQALLSIFELEDSGKKHPWVAIVIQSPDRFDDTLLISNWINKNKTLLINN